LRAAFTISQRCINSSRVIGVAIYTGCQILQHAIPSTMPETFLQGLSP
jgi:hypothetical protein